MLLLAGRAAGTAGTRLILAGSATALALDAATGMLLILFNQNTTGLFAWGSGSLAQLNIDASVRAFPWWPWCCASLWHCPGGWT